MNRTDRAIQCLNSWHNHNMVDEIVLVDWNSERPLSEISEIKSMPKLNLIRVDNKKEFNLGQAYNLGILSAKNELILKIDIDHILNQKDFFVFIQKSIQSVQNKKYITGRGESKAWYYGFAFFTKASFIEAGLFNENLSGWGYDNEDLYNRMNNNLKEIPIQLKPFVFHLSHGDDLRVANYKEKNKDWSYEKNKMVVTNYLSKLG